MKKQSTKEFIAEMDKKHEKLNSERIKSGLLPCPFCWKWNKGEKGLKMHTVLCWYNPENKSCFTCSKFHYKKRGWGSEMVCDDIQDVYLSERKNNCEKHNLKS